MLQNKYQHIVLFDFETTGLNPKKDKVIEIGAILLKLNPLTDKFEPLDELDVLIKNNEPLTPIITEITGITDDMLESEGITELEAYHKFMQLYTKDALLIAYNIQFDISFLIALFQRCDPLSSCLIENDILDVMALYKDRHPYPHRLKEAIERYRIDLPNSHRALDDIKATLEVLKAMMKEKNNIEKYINVIGFNPKYGLSGHKLPHVKYVAQYGNKREIERLT